MGKRIKKFLSVALSIAMIATSVNVSNIAVKADATQYSGTELEDSVNKTLNGGSYYLTKDVTFSPSADGSSGLTIASGATVKIYLNGHTLKSTGSNATNGTNGGNGSRPDSSSGSTANGGTAGTGGTAGYAGIKLPSDSTLVFIGSGTVTANGGKAGNGGNGGAGGSGRLIDDGTDYAMPGSGGGGGGAGGGAGAGIGTDGTNGTAGSAGGNGVTVVANTETGNSEPNNASSTSGSSNSSSPGKLMLYSDYNGAITVNATGGTSGTAGTGGSAGTNGNSASSGWNRNYTASGGAGGGSGAGGGAAYNIGSGGTGGTGGTGGGSGGTAGRDRNRGYSYRLGQVGKGGKGGLSSGRNGSDGGSARNTDQYNIDWERNNVSNANFDVRGTAPTAGTSGNRGSIKTTANLYLAGVYAFTKNADSLYKIGDYITENDIDVYAVYSTSTTATVDQDKQLSYYYDSSMTDYDVNPNTNGFWSRKVDVDDFYLKDAKTTGEHEGEFEFTAEFVKSIMCTDEETKPTANVGVILENIAGENSKKSGFVADVKVDVNERETTEGTDEGTDKSDQDELGNYPTEGNASKFNENKALRTVYYDGVKHSISDLISYIGYGYNNGQDSTVAVTDDFFKNGLDTIQSDNTYWLNKYAMAPYYKVHYMPYYTGEETVTGEYLTGDSTGVVIDGKESASPYYAKGQIDNKIIKDAGYYTIDVTVPYRYRTYRYFRGWSSYRYYYRTYKFNILIRKADLDIHATADTVHENTKVQNHTFTRFTEGQNEDVFGEFVYCSSTQTWGNSEARSANEATPLIEDITWEFNVYYDIDKNNYLCQIDGENVGDALNSYYSGFNGTLLYAAETVGSRTIDMDVNVLYQHEQSTTNERTEVEDLKTTKVGSDDTDKVIKSVYAEKIGFEADINKQSKSIGFRVAKGDAVTGDTAMGTKIYDDSTVPEGYKQYFNNLVEEGKYKGDVYKITIKAGKDVVYEKFYTDTDVTAVSRMAMQITDQLEACEYRNIDAYDVKIDYIGLYYTTETSAEGRKATWNGEEEFNWVVSSVDFKIDVEQRVLKLKELTDINKKYDRSDVIEKQDFDDQGNPIKSNGYIIDVATNKDTESQYQKKGTSVFDNYFDTSNESTNSFRIELSGNYEDKNKGAEKKVTIDKYRLQKYEDNNSYLNYKVEDTTVECKGDIDVAKMYFTHKLFGTMEVYDSTPIHELLGISVKGYIFDTEKEKDGYVIPKDTSYEELIEKNDVKLNPDAFPTNSEDYEYDVFYAIETNEYTPKDLLIDNETGEIVTVAENTKGGNNASHFPSMFVLISDNDNFTTVLQPETQEVDIYKECSKYGENTINYSYEMTMHDIRFRIVGNENTYDVLLPKNQLNKAGKDSKFIDAAVASVTNNDEIFDYLTIYEEGDESEFEFTIPQNSYLSDVHIIDLDDYKVYSSEPISTFSEMKGLLETKSLGSFNTQEDTLNKNENPLYLKLKEINGEEASAIPAANAQVGGSKFRFNIKTGNSVLGNDKAIAIIPVFTEYKLIDDTYKENVSVEEVPNAGEMTAGENGCIYVNYKNKVDTNPFNQKWAQIELKYGTGDDTTSLTHKITTKQLVGDQSVKFDSKLAANKEFFAADKLIPGTKVSVKIKLWRDGITQGFNLKNDDPDAFEEKTFEWEVTEEEYYRIFDDQTIIFRSDSDVTKLDNICAYAVYDGDEAAVKFGKVPTLVEKQEDGTWTVKENVNMLSIADTWYKADKEGTTRIVIANDKENNYPIKKVGETDTDKLAKGTVLYPTYEVAELHYADGMSEEAVDWGAVGYARVVFGELTPYGNMIFSENKEDLTKVAPFTVPDKTWDVSYEKLQPYTSYEWYKDSALTKVISAESACDVNNEDKIYLKLGIETIKFVVGEEEVGKAAYDGNSVPPKTDLTKAYFWPANLTDDEKAANIESYKNRILKIGDAGQNDDSGLTDMSKYKQDTYEEGKWCYDSECLKPIEDLSNTALATEDIEKVETLYLAPILVSTITAEDAEMRIGESATLNVTALPEDAHDKSVEFKSNDENIATVDENGVVTGVNVGETTITIIAKDNGKVEGTAKVTIKPILVNKITLEDKTLTAGDKVTLTAKVEPENATDKSVTWKSDNEAVATVDDKGEVTAKAYGKATITATAKDEGKVVGSAVITVNDKPVSSAEKKANSLELNKGLKIVASKNIATVEWNKVKDAEEYKVFVQYCSKKFDKGTVISAKKDISKIKIKKVNGKKLSSKKNYKIVVKAYKTVNGKQVEIAKSIVGHFVSDKHKKYSNPAKIKLKKTKFTLAVGKTDKIKGKVILKNKKKKALSKKHAATFRFSTANSSIAKISKSGKITAVKAGTTSIYVYAKNGMTKTVKVTVK